MRDPERHGPAADTAPKPSGKRFREYLAMFFADIAGRLEKSYANLKKQLSDAQEQQTATSEVLGVISRSPGELEPVFRTMLANAIRLCEAKFGVLFRYDSGAFRAAAWLGVTPAYAEFLRQRGSFRPAGGAPLYQPKQKHEQRRHLNSRHLLAGYR